MTNLRFTKDTVRVRRVAALSAAAAVIAVATAAAYPAQGAAAPHRHHLELSHSCGSSITPCAYTGARQTMRSRFGSRPATPGSSRWTSATTARPTSASHGPRSRRSEIEGRGGDDRLHIDDTNGAFTNTIPTRIDGGPGNDTIAGGAGAETLIGGPGNDTIDGNAGSDVSDLGPGDDSFVWDPGDGSDSIEGGPGSDALVFNGAAASETVDLSANGNRLLFSRQPANITMDTHGVERVDFNALGGADAITVNDLTRTDVKNVNLDLAGALGGATGDGQNDSVVVVGTNESDAINAAGDPSGVTVSGLRTQVAIQHQDPTDQLFVLGVGGDDSISATGLAAGAITEFLEGGDGNDTIAGGPGAETLLGGNGNDTIDGNGGSDRAGLGAGDDTFVWDPGDGSDTIEGEDGRDTMVFNGAAAAETVDLSANGDRLRFFRQPANITMDTGGVEFVVFNALGGADNVTVGDLTGTDVTSVDLNLAGALGGTTGDGQTDRVVVNGTNGDDAVTVAGGAGNVNVSGLAPTVNLLHAEAADQLDFENFEVNDTVASGGLAAGTIQLFLDGVLIP